MFSFQRRAELSARWRRLSSSLFKQTTLGSFSELMRRWRLLRGVVLRTMNLKLAVGWSRWLEIDRGQQRATDRRKWKQLGKSLFLKTGLGMLVELVRR